jgi:acylphosphatase
VRNEPDGTVRGHFEGEQGAVERLVDWCRQGPRHAHVEAVDVSDAETSGISGFDAR